MNRRLIIGIAAVAMLFGVSARSMVVANTTPATQNTAKQGPFYRLREALAQLDLTADQKAKIKQIVGDARGKLQQLKADAPNGTIDKAQAREIIKAARQQILEVLTPAQKAKLREILKAEKTGQT